MTSNLPRENALEKAARAHGIALQYFDDLEGAAKGLFFGDATDPEPSGQARDPSSNNPWKIILPRSLIIDQQSHKLSLR
jgi:hypothetical protein